MAVLHFFLVLALSQFLLKLLHTTPIRLLGGCCGCCGCWGYCGGGAPPPPWEGGGVDCGGGMKAQGLLLAPPIEGDQQPRKTVRCSIGRLSITDMAKQLLMQPDPMSWLVLQMTKKSSAKEEAEGRTIRESARKSRFPRRHSSLQSVRDADDGDNFNVDVPLHGGLATPEVVLLQLHRQIPSRQAFLRQTLAVVLFLCSQVRPFKPWFDLLIILQFQMDGVGTPPLN